MTKKITLIILFFLMILGIGSWFYKDNIISTLQQKQLSSELKSFKFLTEVEKSHAWNEFNTQWNKIKVVNKYQKINSKYQNFTDNYNYLINPSSIKSINNYQPSLVDLSINHINILTKNAITNKEGSVAKILVNDLLDLIDSAQAKGIKIQVNSAYRSFEKQILIQKELKAVAAMPGQSEHQSGLAIDFNQPNYEVFKDSPAYKWLLANAFKFGFILSFSEHNAKLTGEAFEQWHWRYIGKRYAELFKHQQVTNNNFTYNDFISKYFGYKFVSSNIYPDTNTLINANNIKNFVIMKNAKVMLESANLITNKLEVISTSLQKNSVYKDKYQVRSQFLENDGVNANFEFKLHQVQELNNDLLKPTIVNTILNSKIMNTTTYKLANICKLNNEVYKNNHSYHLSNSQGSVTYIENMNLMSVIYLNHGCLGILRQISNYNEQELLKQRDLIYQLLKLNKFKI